MSKFVATGTYLDRILANTRREVEERKHVVPEESLRERYAGLPAPISLAQSLKRNGVQVIAEFKRASPSKGEIVPGASAAQIATEYLEGGAAAISVLTDGTFFQGSLTDLEEIATLAHRHNVPRPVLRKDFAIDPYQIHEARAHGADAILLIAAALNDVQIEELTSTARSLGLDILVEVHDEHELQRVLPLAPEIVGVNNRDLRTFEVTLETTEALAPKIPSGVVLVGESGIHSRADVDRLAKSGVHAVLVGESLMRKDDRVAALRELTS